MKAIYMDKTGRIWVFEEGKIRRATAKETKTYMEGFRHDT